MKKKNIIGLLLIGTLSLGSLVGCGEGVSKEQDSDKQASVQQEEILKQGNDQVGLPNITNFYEKKLAKKIIELRDDSKLVTYAYTTNMNGKYVYLGKCMGYGLPYDTQYTNPQKVDTVDGGQYGARNPYVLNQADPNGLFSGSGTSATWLMLIDETTGEQSVVYAEPNMLITQTKLPKRLIETWSLPDNY
jgi:hypothetical protein